MKDTIIDFNNVSFSYGTQTEGCLKNINLKIRMGEFVLFTGASGSGKTTVMRLINGLIPHFFEGNLSGQVKVLGRGIKISFLQQIALMKPHLPVKIMESTETK